MGVPSGIPFFVPDFYIFPETGHYRFTSMCKSWVEYQTVIFRPPVPSMVD